MTDAAERRKFPRLGVEGDAFVYDDGGKLLGRISTAGGGGATILLDSQAIAAELPLGRRLRITIEEGADRHTFEVIVRFSDLNRAGVEFAPGVTGPALK